MRGVMKNTKTIHLTELPSDLGGYDHVLLIGPKERLETFVEAQGDVAFKGGVAQGLHAPLESIESAEKGGKAETYLQVSHPKREGSISQRVFFGALPTRASRMNSPARADAASKLISGATPSKGRSIVVLCPNVAEHAAPLMVAAARAFPTLTFKSGATQSVVDLSVWLEDEEARAELDWERLEALALGAQRAAAWVDTPPEQLNVPQMVEAARDIAARYDVEIDVFEGEEVMQMGLGGLWAVGKAATHPPALVVLRGPQSAPDAPQAVWVGKGVLYDTGGLALKPKAGMSGMKMDMGGSAGVLGAFEAAARCGLHEDLTAILCLAENAIGPDAFRNDDVLTMYSGKTVEVNNTDAEGRLILADGVAYACRHLRPSLIVDMATLTGAQLVSTGRQHAAILSNQAELEELAVEVGLQSGDLVHPLPYCPELLNSEFKSEVADMRNSVKDRMNAQSSCAGHFIEQHLVGVSGEAYQGGWLHVDIAGPAFQGGRGTGYGVALLVSLHEAWARGRGRSAR